MDLTRLQSVFTRFVRSLFGMGYLDDGFRSLYVRNGLPMDSHFVSVSLLVFSLAIETHSDLLASSWGDPLLNPLCVVLEADKLSAAARNIGAARIVTLCDHLRASAESLDRRGCIMYQRMLAFEYMTLMSALSSVLKLHVAIERLGGWAPLDW